MKDSSLSIKDSRNDKRIKSLTLLLKCLKIMENATFLSNENQVDMCSLPACLLINCLFIFIDVIFAVLNFTCVAFSICIA